MASDNAYINNVYIRFSCAKTKFTCESPIGVEKCSLFSTIENIFKKQE